MIFIMNCLHLKNQSIKLVIDNSLTQNFVKLYTIFFYINLPIYMYLPINSDEKYLISTQVVSFAIFCSGSHQIVAQKDPSFLHHILICQLNIVQFQVLLHRRIFFHHNCTLKGIFKISCFQF